jgi:hypothetical protein
VSAIQKRSCGRFEEIGVVAELPLPFGSRFSDLSRKPSPGSSRAAGGTALGAPIRVEPLRDGATGEGAVRRPSGFGERVHRQLPGDRAVADAGGAQLREANE